MLPRYDYTIIIRAFNYVLLLLVFLLLTLTAELTKNTYFRNSVDVIILINTRYALLDCL